MTLLAAAGAPSVSLASAQQARDCEVVAARRQRRPSWCRGHRGWPWVGGSVIPHSRTTSGRCLRSAQRSLVAEVELDPRDAATTHPVDQAELYLELGLLSPRPARDRDERNDAVADRIEEVDGVTHVLVGTVVLPVPPEVASGSPARGRAGPTVGLDDLDVGVVPASVMRPDAGLVLARRRVERLERPSHVFDVLVADSHRRTLSAGRLERWLEFYEGRSNTDASSPRALIPTFG